MVKEHVLERYLDALLTGDRMACRGVIEETLQTGMTASSVYTEVIWPIMLEIEKLSRLDRITAAQEALATRINRTIVDQLQNKLPRKDKRQRKVVVCSATDENCELGAQIIADLFESDGWDVRFLGGTVDTDEIMSFVHSYSPDVLLVHGIGPKRAPEMRRLIDTVRGINAWPDMRIMVSGGVFARAEGLWEEIGADLYAAGAAEAVQLAATDEEDIDKPRRTINRRKRKQLETAESIEIGA